MVKKAKNKNIVKEETQEEVIQVSNLEELNEIEKKEEVKEQDNKIKYSPKRLETLQQARIKAAEIKKKNKLYNKFGMSCTLDTFKYIPILCYFLVPTFSISGAATIHLVTDTWPSIFIY